MTLSILAVATGHLAAVEEQAVALVQSLQTAAAEEPDLEVVLVLDSPEWRKALPLIRSTKFKVVEADEPDATPGRLFNLAAAHAEGPHVAFAWPGVDFDSARRHLKRLHGPAVSDEIRFLASWFGPGDSRRLPPHSWLPAEADQYPLAFPLGWLQLADLVPMHESLVELDLLKELPFHEGPELQAGFWWDFCLRVARREEVICQGLPAADALSWWRFPFARTTYGDGDSAARQIMRRQAAAPVLPTVPEQARNQGPRSVEIEGRRLDAPWDRTLRVTILGGVNEPAHNQLCFFNYFERLREAGWLEWRTVLDTAAHDLDVLRSDLVIFSRVKSPAGRRLIDVCRRQRVPTIYMIDDNWFRVAEDFPIYREAFAPGSPFMQVFLHCLDRADLTLTYNPILADDVRPHAREVALIETNIDTTLFPRRERDPSRTVLGYVGSARTDSLAIEALCDVVEADRKAELFFMSGAIPEAVHRVPADRRTVSTYLFDYARYAATVCKAAPDVLIAPLGPTGFEQSKCPNKYLEMTAAGAVGVYADVPLYRRYVREGETGLFAKQNTRRAWREAIEQAVALGHERRAAMAAQAYADVQTNFRTEARLPDVVSVLARALEIGRERKSRGPATRPEAGEAKALEGAA